MFPPLPTKIPNTEPNRRAPRKKGLWSCVGRTHHPPCSSWTPKSPYPLDPRDLLLPPPPLVSPHEARGTALFCGAAEPVGPKVVPHQAGPSWPWLQHSAHTPPGGEASEDSGPLMSHLPSSRPHPPSPRPRAPTPIPVPMKVKPHLLVESSSSESKKLVVSSSLLIRVDELS